jgi:hypothetical protein
MAVLLSAFETSLKLNKVIDFVRSMRETNGIHIELKTILKLKFVITIIK